MTNNTFKMPKQDVPDVVGLASAYGAGTFIDAHSHPAHQIVHAISGTMRVTVQDRIWFVPPGRALWVPAQVQHAIQCVGSTEMRTAYLSPACPMAHADVCVVSVSRLMREVLVRLAEASRSDITLLLADVLLAEIRQGMIEPLSLPIPHDPRIARMARRFQTDPDDQTTLAQWARRLGYSERGLIRHVRAETGMTFRELRRLTRAMVALEHLASGQSVTATAYDVGFETPSAFIHAFRVVMGTTPRQFMAGG